MLHDVQPTPTREPRADSNRSYDVLVVGAGQTGLTVEYYLQQAGLRFLIVDPAE
jgi:cation diffusion facilitator CzcD-associated flavoprotein CzcO